MAAPIEDEENDMQAKVGDRLVIRSQHLDGPVRHAEILEVRGPNGTPPYRVRWSDSGNEAFCFPGPDAYVEPHEGQPRAPDRGAGP